MLSYSDCALKAPATHIYTSNIMSDLGCRLLQSLCASLRFFSSGQAKDRLEVLLWVQQDVRPPPFVSNQQWEGYICSAETFAVQSFAWKTLKQCCPTQHCTTLLDIYPKDVELMFCLQKNPGWSLHHPAEGESAENPKSHFQSEYTRGGSESTNRLQAEA